MSRKYFHFTLGPVQSFVAQARRTKDFWAGSFLLSYLSGVAMVATQHQGGKILFPLPDQAYLDVLTGKGDTKPRQGNIPNRFKAEVPEDFSAHKVVDTVRRVWKALAETVWENDLSGYAGSETETIWRRQIGGFWETSWAMTKDAAASNLLDRRKNWRTHLLPDEPGQKCAIMAGLQELSGEETAQSKAQREFWKNLRKSKKNFELDIGESERLSAIAFVKRRFVRYFGQFNCHVDGVDFTGWELSSNVPSVALLAAAPWLAGVARHENIDALIDAADAIGAREMPLSELKMLRESGNRDILRLDGTVVFDVLLDNRSLYPDRSKAHAVQKALRPLYKENAPSPFYAILMMDGDRLGIQMGDSAKQAPISKALQAFTNSVEEVVDDHSGFLIYAGGDDVLAILPLETALQCAAALRGQYVSAFENNAPDVETSISAAIVFSHIKNPLHSVLHHIHSLLDDVAKDRTGRDAVAIETIKPGGVQLIWAKKWDEALDGERNFVLQELADAYRDQTEKGQFASSFFYRIREIMEVLQGIGERKQQEKVLAVEYRAGTALKQEEALRIISPLLAQCQDTDEAIRPEAALLVRFLAQKGVER